MAPDKPALRLTITFDGPLVEQHRLPLSEFVRVTKQFHAALQDVATVLSGYGPSGHMGRAKRFIEDATDLTVVAPPRAGSLVLELELPREPPGAEALPLEMAPGLGELAVYSLVGGLDELRDDVVRLPSGFDPGVLKAIKQFRTSIKKGLTEIRFSAYGATTETVGRIDAEKVDTVVRLIKKPVRARATAFGTLEMVDFKSLRCRIDRPPLPSVLCQFEEKDRDTVQAAIRQFVYVAGEGQFEPGEREPSKIWVASIEIRYEVLPFDPQTFWARTSPQQALVSEGLRITPFEPGTRDDDSWRDDDEAARLIAAIHS